MFFLGSPGDVSGWIVLADVVERVKRFVTDDKDGKKAAALDAAKGLLGGSAVKVRTLGAVEKAELDEAADRAASRAERVRSDIERVSKALVEMREPALVGFDDRAVAERVVMSPFNWVVQIAITDAQTIDPEERAAFFTRAQAGATGPAPLVTTGSGQSSDAQSHQPRSTFQAAPTSRGDAPGLRLIGPEG